MKPFDADKESLMTFPCDFRVKAMGVNTSGFQSLVVGVVRRHLEPDVQVEAHSVASRADKYLSVTVGFTATSRAQLDAIYLDLSDEPAVLVAL